MKTCKRCFQEFEESEIEVVDVSPATELADYLDSRFHGNGRRTNGNDRGETDIDVEDISDFCPQCREELDVMDLFCLRSLVFSGSGDLWYRHLYTHHPGHCYRRQDHPHP